MPFKVIEIATPDDRVRAITSVVEEMEATDVQVGPPLSDGRHPIRILVGETDRQALLDRLQSALGKSENWRIAIMPTDAVLPRPEEKAKPEEEEKKSEAEEKESKEEQERASREELYNLVAAGVRMDATFILLVILSTVVASVGMERDNVAVVIGAMVIAPLLGPHLAFAFAAAIGDHGLMLSALKASVAGIVLSIAVGAAFALLAPPDLDSTELMARTSLDYSTIVLALASGAAAALSVTTGLSSTLVGVMVAVALLPPAATVGIMAASERPELAIGAAMLLGANVACVNLAAQVVFIGKGIRPRLWHERKTARTAVVVNLSTWIVLLLGLIAIIALRK